MSIEDLSPFALQRIDPYEGMTVDAAIWRDAHTYHRTAQRLHTRALHGWGIVEGLEVMAADPPGRAVILRPGLAIDRDGNVIRVPQPIRVEPRQSRTGTLCLVLRFAEAAPSSSNGARSPRVDETYEVLEGTLPLGPLDIEIARVEVQDARAPFGDAQNPWDVGPGEIDLRFRHQMAPALADTVTVGYLVTGKSAGPPLHLQGLINLLRDVQATSPFCAQYVGPVQPATAPGYCSVLYVAGAGEFQITPREATQLVAFVRGGGVLYAEPCVEQETQQQENGRFVASFQSLMADLTLDLSEMQVAHPAFQARHVFGLPPEGTGGRAPLLCHDAVILNPNDYGCCWQGGAPQKPLDRETIRSAIEFGANIAWYAAQRSYRRQVGTTA
jgi:hypothetical protein